MDGLTVGSLGHYGFFFCVYRIPARYLQRETSSSLYHRGPITN